MYGYQCDFKKKSIYIYIVDNTSRRVYFFVSNFISWFECTIYVYLKPFRTLKTKTVVGVLDFWNIYISIGSNTLRCVSFWVLASFGLALASTVVGAGEEVELGYVATSRGKWAEPPDDPVQAEAHGGKDALRRSQSPRAELKTSFEMWPKDPPKRQNLSQNENPGRADDGG